MAYDELSLSPLNSMDILILGYDIIEYCLGYCFELLSPSLCSVPAFQFFLMRKFPKSSMNHATVAMCEPFLKPFVFLVFFFSFFLFSK